MKIKTILDNICVKPSEVDKQTASGLYIPETSNELPIKGIVVSVGTGRISRDGNIVPLNINKGDTVMYPQGAGHSIKLDDEEHLILTEDQILAIVD
jgi:chaperonin GroES